MASEIVKSNNKNIYAIDLLWELCWLKWSLHVLYYSLLPWQWKTYDNWQLFFFCSILISATALATWLSPQLWGLKLGLKVLTSTIRARLRACSSLVLELHCELSLLSCITKIVWLTIFINNGIFGNLIITIKRLCHNWRKVS